MSKKEGERKNGKEREEYGEKLKRGRVVRREGERNNGGEREILTTPLGIVNLMPGNGNQWE